jgi:hypothetical protein
MLVLQGALDDIGGIRGDGVKPSACAAARPAG